MHFEVNKLDQNLIRTRGRYMYEVLEEENSDKESGQARWH